MASREPEIALERGRSVIIAHIPDAEANAWRDLVRGVIREELRKCGLRPPVPADLGAYRWDAESDSWVPTT